MKLSRLTALALVLPLGLSSTSCATVAGTAVSPITGGVDLARRNATQEEWYMIPVYFIGGAIGGPFVAFYNGVNFDVTHMEDTNYWEHFAPVFRPYELLEVGAQRATVPLD